MNLFILSTCPIEAAQQQCDKHVPKMIVESGQMLSTTHRMLDGTMEKRPSKSGKTMVKYWRMENKHYETTLYNAVHTAHPCTVWSMESSENYKWHYEHFLALCDEYTYRYGKIHKTDRVLRDILSIMPVNIPQKNKLTEFKLAMKANPECIALGDPVKAYQAFYQTKQDRFKMVWTKRDVPSWFKYNANAYI
jgi:hypothetical protein